MNARIESENIEQPIQWHPREKQYMLLQATASKAGNMYLSKGKAVLRDNRLFHRLHEQQHEFFQYTDYWAQNEDYLASDRTLANFYVSSDNTHIVFVRR